MCYTGVNMIDGTRERRIVDEVIPQDHGAPEPEAVLDDAEPTVRVARTPQPRPRRTAPDVFIREALRDGQSIEQLRAATLAELDAANDSVENTKGAFALASERKYKRQMEERLAAIEERRKPAVAYYDARTQYEAAVAAIDSAHPDHRKDAVEHVWFWRSQLEAHGKRLAEEQVEHDMRAFDLDVYRRGLESTYAKLAEREDEYDDTAPELLEMAFIKQKIAVFSERMENEGLKRRLHVERQRSTMKRAMERTGHAITQLEKTRKSLNWFNPFHWRQITDIDNRLTVMRHEQEDAQQRYRLAAATDVQSEIGIRMPEPSRPRPSHTVNGTRRAA